MGPRAPSRLPWGPVSTPQPPEAPGADSPHAPSLGTLLRHAELTPGEADMQHWVGLWYKHLAPPAHGGQFRRSVKALSVLCPVRASR